MEITINGSPVEASMSVLTLVLYEQEFDGADMIADLNGKVMADSNDEGVLFDFASVPWTKLMQGAWAMVKTADKSTPHFAKWAEGITEVNSFEVRNVLQEATSDAFFHIAAADGGEHGEDQ